jgi:pimeloyl-ACP methyl ester carboxylesterase
MTRSKRRVPTLPRATTLPRPARRSARLDRRAASREVRRAARHYLAPSEELIDADILRLPVGPGAIHVERYGHGGRPVVLVHGFGTSSFLWRNVAPALAVAHFTAVAVDLLGYGESDRPFDAVFGVAAQADYLDRALTALRLARASLVGVDLGGGVALRLAALRPERVERLVLVNSVAPGALPAGDVRALLGRHRGSLAHALLRLLGSARGVLGAAPLLTPVLEQSVADPAHMPPRLVARYLAPYVGKDGVTQLLQLARSVRAQDLHAVDLSQLAAPTLVVWGERDGWLEPEVGARLAREIPDARLIGVPDAARLVPEDAPEALASMVVDFLRGTV